MSHFVLERLRNKVEELETVEKAIAIKLAENLDVGDDVILATGEVKKRPFKGKTHLSNLRNEHFLSFGLNKAIKMAQECTESLENNKRLRTEVSEIMDNDIEMFTQAYVEIKEQDLSNATLINSAEDMKTELGEVTAPLLLDTNRNILQNVEKMMKFSGEEYYGRCLDVHQFHQVFVNLFEQDDKLGNITYIDYIDRLAVFASIDYSKVKVSAKYYEYLIFLATYLSSFQARIQPLVEINLQQIHSEFEQKMQSGQFEDWKSINPDDSELLEKCNDHSLSRDQLTVELIFRGLKCGGREVDRMVRLKRNLTKFGMKQVEIEELKVKLDERVYSKRDRVNSKFSVSRTAFVEFFIKYLLNKLEDNVVKTREKLTKRATQSYRERKAELELLEKAEEQLILDEKAEKEVVEEESNKKREYESKLPIGRDGNPIPRWLYKMNGMNFEFKCEICGNASYQGRLNFERHFQENRHTSGMKLLGIPNTKHFQSVTKISDARELYLKLQKQVNKDFSVEEEFETDDGRKVVHRQNISFV